MSTRLSIQIKTVALFLLLYHREYSSNEVAEELARADELRRKEAERLRNEMEDEKKAQGNSITQMFDRLKGENESRKLEIHGKNTFSTVQPKGVK